MQIVLEHRARATEEEIGLKWGMSERNVRRIIRDFTESMPEPMREPMERVEIHLEQLRSVTEELALISQNTKDDRVRVSAIGKKLQAQAEPSRTYARLEMIPNLGPTDAEQVEMLADEFLLWCSTATFHDRPIDPKVIKAMRELLDTYRNSLEGG